MSAILWRSLPGDDVAAATAERVSAVASLSGRKLTKTCPSAPAEPGSALMGMVIAPGQVAYLSPTVPVTTELLDELKASGVPIENRMRFAGACMERGCVQWSAESGGGRCGLVDRALAALSITSGLDDLPKCGIRLTCRWFYQHQAKACAACPEVIRRPAGK
jgi:hypothetical protein